MEKLFLHLHNREQHQVSSDFQKNIDNPLGNSNLHFGHDKHLHAILDWGMHPELNQPDNLKYRSLQQQHDRENLMFLMFCNKDRGMGFGRILEDMCKTRLTSYTSRHANLIEDRYREIRQNSTFLDSK